MLHFEHQGFEFVLAVVGSCEFSRLKSLLEPIKGEVLGFFLKGLVLEALEELHSVVDGFVRGVLGARMKASLDRNVSCKFKHWHFLLLVEVLLLFLQFLLFNWVYEHQTRFFLLLYGKLSSWLL